MCAIKVIKLRLYTDVYLVLSVSRLQELVIVVIDKSVTQRKLKLVITRNAWQSPVYSTPGIAKNKCAAP